MNKIPPPIIDMILEKLDNKSFFRCLLAAKVFHAHNYYLTARLHYQDRLIKCLKYKINKIQKDHDMVVCGLKNKNERDKEYMERKCRNLQEEINSIELSIKDKNSLLYQGDNNYPRYAIFKP